jgi:signal transduction histidine kinase
MKRWNKPVAAAALFVLAAFAHADSVGDARALVTAAQTELTDTSMKDAAAEFNSGGRWRTGKAYVVLVGFDGHMFAHADNPKMTGKNMLEAKDASGKPFIHETIENVKAKGESLVDFRWTNPSTHKIDNGHLIARRVPGQDAYVAVAFFD